MPGEKHLEWDAAFNQLKEMSQAIDTRIKEGGGNISKLLDQQSQLIAKARELTRSQVEELLGKLNLNTDQIAGAIEYANAVLKDIDDTNKAIEKIGMVIGFITILLSGDATKIYSAAKNLKNGLDDA